MEIHFTKLFPTCVTHYYLAKSFTETSITEDELIIMIGFNNGEIMLWHLLESKYIRFNKSVSCYRIESVMSLSLSSRPSSHVLCLCFMVHVCRIGHVQHVPRDRAGLDSRI